VVTYYLPLLALYFKTFYLLVETNAFSLA